MHWDAVVIDESHNLIGERNLRNRLAKRLAKRTDALLLASATPHNGDARSFAELIDMLDPAAIADDRNYAAKDIAHLYIRRTKISDEVTNEIGGKWRERGPSQAIRCPASPAEEDVFAELTRVWLADPTVAPGAGTDRRLFPYTLLKAFLSSHKALAVTARKRAKNTGDQTERAALTRLAALADQVTDDDSAKLTALVAKLKEIGVGPYSTTRAVVFSESVPTLEWLRNTLPGRLGLTKEGQVELMHGALSDIQQHGIIERFSLDDPPVRVLLTGDVASEGVNMHKQCHHLIHYDLPWSLIRIEQRNGRIDRYGQVHQPEFAALILISQTEGAKDDTTVAEKLLAREATAHSQLGTAEGVTRQFTSKKEEDRLVKDLLAGKTVDESIDAADARTRPPTSSPTCWQASATSRRTPRRTRPGCRACSGPRRRSPAPPSAPPRRSCASTTTARCSPSGRRMTWCSACPCCRPRTSKCTTSPNGCGSRSAGRSRRRTLTRPSGPKRSGPRSPTCPTCTR